MNSYIMDAGFLYALIDNTDRFSVDVRRCLDQIEGEIFIPTPAITETAYFVWKNLGQAVLAEFLEDLSKMGLHFENPLPQDYLRAAGVVRKYGDSNLDFVDACIFAVAERLEIKNVLTIDRRHFGMFRPAHCDHFDILP